MFLVLFIYILIVLFLLTICIFDYLIFVTVLSLRATSYSVEVLSLVTLGVFHLVKISGISGSAVNRTRFVGSSHWKIPRKSGKSKKVDPFSRLEFPNGISCSIYNFFVVCTSSRSTARKSVTAR